MPSALRFAAHAYINTNAFAGRMTLQSVLASMERPVKSELVGEIINYMKSMPKDKESLVLECAEHLEQSQSLAAVLAVVHALNEGEFLLKSREDDDDLLLDMDLSKELEKLMAEDKKDTVSAPL